MATNAPLNNALTIARATDIIDARSKQLITKPGKYETVRIISCNKYVDGQKIAIANVNLVTEYQLNLAMELIEKADNLVASGTPEESFQVQDLLQKATNKACLSATIFQGQFVPEKGDHVNVLIEAFIDAKTNTQGLRVKSIIEAKAVVIEAPALSFKERLALRKGSALVEETPFIETPELEFAPAQAKK